ncbi:MAG: hypothetical protein ABJB93_09100, partial [Gaiellales bacterium]
RCAGAATASRSDEVQPLDVDREEVPGSEAVAIDLADYGVPVHVCDGRTAREVIEALAREARPLSKAKVEG